jgi:hypothetical protein
MKSDKIRNLIKIFLTIITKNIFYVCLLLLFLSLLIGAFVFYEYVITPQKITLNISEEFFLLKEESRQRILEEWQAREKKFIQSDLNEYLNPFEEATVPVAHEELTE